MNNNRNDFTNQGPVHDQSDHDQGTGSSIPLAIQGGVASVPVNSNGANHSAARPAAGLSDGRRSDSPSSSFHHPVPNFLFLDENKTGDNTTTPGGGDSAAKQLVATLQEQLQEQLPDFENYHKLLLWTLDMFNALLASDAFSLDDTGLVSCINHYVEHNDIEHLGVNKLCAKLRSFFYLLSYVHSQVLFKLHKCYWYILE